MRWLKSTTICTSGQYSRMRSHRKTRSCESVAVIPTYLNPCSLMVARMRESTSSVVGLVIPGVICGTESRDSRSCSKFSWSVWFSPGTSNNPRFAVAPISERIFDRCNGNGNVVISSDRPPSLIGLPLNSVNQLPKLVLASCSHAMRRGCLERRDSSRNRIAARNARRAGIRTDANDFNVPWLSSRMRGRLTFEALPEMTSN